MALLRQPSMFRLWVACAMFEAGWMAFAFVVPVRGTELGFSASNIGLISGTAGVTLFLVRLFMTPLLRLITPWQMLLGGMIVLGIGFLGFAVGTQLVWLLFCAALIGIGQGVASPMINAMIYEQAPSHEAGEALSLRSLISNAAQAAVPMVAGPIGAVFGLSPVFWLLAAGLFGTAWWSRGQWSLRQNNSRDPAA